MVCPPVELCTWGRTTLSVYERNSIRKFWSRFGDELLLWSFVAIHYEHRVKLYNSQ